MVSRILLAPHTLLLASGLGTILLTIGCGVLAIKLRRLAHWYMAWRNPAVAASQRLLASKRQPMIGAVGPAVGGATEVAPVSLVSIIFSGVGINRALQTGFFIVGALGFIRLMWALLVSHRITYPPQSVSFLHQSAAEFSASAFVLIFCELPGFCRLVIAFFGD